MKLSELANRYVQGLRIDPYWNFQDRDAIVKYMSSQNITAFPRIVDLQIEYSGKTLALRGKPKSSFHIQLFSKKDIHYGNELDILLIDGRYYFDCGTHETAQFWFVVGEDGCFGTYSQDEENVNILYADFTNLIESYALENEIIKKGFYESEYYLVISDIRDIHDMVIGLKRYEFINDQFVFWYGNNSVFLNIAKFYGTDSYYVHIFGEKKIYASELISRLSQLGFIKLENI